MNAGMTRTQFLGALAAAGLGAQSAFPQPNSPTRPNLLVICTDDQTFRGIGYNNPLVKTPHCDALAQEGIVFDHFYVASPICVASRSSVFTGLFPQQHGVVALDNNAFETNVVQEKRHAVFPQLLSDAGYRTVYCGKAHVADPRNFGFMEGKEHYDPQDSEAFDFAGQFLRGRQDGDRPFLLWVAPRQPHVPLMPAQEWLDLYPASQIQLPPNFRESPPPGSFYNQGKPGEQYYRDSDYTQNYKDLPSGPPRNREQMVEFIRAYYASISHLDAQIGGLVDDLKASGQYDNTLIVFLSDNGYHLGSHGLGNKITMHEESVRVPMFVHGSRLPRKGAHSAALASSVDIFPTLLELAGVSVPTGLPGISLVPLFAQPKGLHRPWVASECTGVGGKVGEGHRMVRTLDWKYMFSDTSEEALYDQRNDPYELANVSGAPENAGVLRIMRQHMQEWMERVGDGHSRPPL